MRESQERSSTVSFVCRSAASAAFCAALASSRAVSASLMVRWSLGS